jgi:YD repeat-containing protein
MMRKKTLTSLIFLLILGLASPLWAQSGASVPYVYDALGRLTTVVDPSGNVATYNYDAVGNLLSITTSTSSPSAPIPISRLARRGAAKALRTDSQGFGFTLGMVLALDLLAMINISLSKAFPQPISVRVFWL